eukprot:929258-Pelagomonas_calceolata.AAC.1
MPAKRPRALKKEGGTEGTGSTQHQPQPLRLPRSVTLASFFQNRHIHLVDVKYCDAAARQPLSQPIKGLTQATLHAISLGVGRIICIPHTLKLEPLKELGLDTHTLYVLHGAFPRPACFSFSFGQAVAWCRTSVGDRNFDEHWVPLP